MKDYENKKLGNKKLSEVKTFPIPLALRVNTEDITIATNTSSKPSKEQIIKQAFKFHSQGNMSKAAEYYQYFLDQGHTDPRVFSNYGIICREKGKNYLAKKLYLKSIKLYPYYSEAYSNLGFLLKEENNLEKALKYINEAIKLGPDKSAAHLNLGAILIDLGKLKEAEFSLRKAIELDPNFAEAHLDLGDLLRQLGRQKEAMLCSEKALEIRPWSVRGLYGLSHTCEIKSSS